MDREEPYSEQELSFMRANEDLYYELKEKQMSKITATTETNDRVLVPAGNHVARCYKMIHYGTIPEKDMAGNEVMKNKVRLEFELPLKTQVFKEGDSPKPFSIGKDYTLSLHEKASLRIDLKSWRGIDLTDEQAKSFDISSMLGQTCMVNVIHNNKNGRTFANISTITPMPDGINAPAQVNSSIVFGYDPFDEVLFSKLPEWQQKKIMSSKEYAIIRG